MQGLTRAIQNHHLEKMQSRFSRLNISLKIIETTKFPVILYFIHPEVQTLWHISFPPKNCILVSLIFFAQECVLSIGTTTRLQTLCKMENNLQMREEKVAKAGFSMKMVMGRCVAALFAISMQYNLTLYKWKVLVDVCWVCLCALNGMSEGVSFKRSVDDSMFCIKEMKQVKPIKKHPYRWGSLLPIDAEIRTPIENEMSDLMTTLYAAT